MRYDKREQKTRINRQIHISPVRVTMDGQNYGVMSLVDALTMADHHGLDLVEIAPHFKPPVCEIMDYPKFKYEQAKRKKGLQQKQPQAKEIHLRPVSSDHDVDIRAEQVKRFLNENRSVTIIVEFKGRSVALSDARDRGAKIIQRILTSVSELGKLDQPAKMEGHRMIARLSPK